MIDNDIDLLEIKLPRGSFTTPGTLTSQHFSPLNVLKGVLGGGGGGSWNDDEPFDAYMTANHLEFLPNMRGGVSDKFSS